MRSKRASGGGNHSRTATLLSSIVEQEMNTRLIAALKSIKAAAEQGPLSHAERADIRVVVLTVVLVINTIRAG